jgi:PleD family two-component response regulator
VQRTYYLFAVTLIGSVGCYLIEYAARYNYLYSKLSLHYAENDALTGLSNRRKFMDALDRAWKLARRESKPVALCLIDTDCFKAYNDAFGHLEGDEALKAVAEAIGSCVRRPDGRRGALRRRGVRRRVVRRRPRRGARARRRAAAVGPRARPRASDSSAGPVLTISAGVALGNPSNSADPIQLLRRADDALYRAKAGGRDRVELAA